MNAQRVSIFLVVCLLMFYENIFGQKNPQKIIYVGIGLGISPAFSPIYGKGLIGYSGTIYGSVLNPDSTVMVLPLYQPVPAGYNLQCLGVICRKEWQLDKLSPVPVRFRLGSLEQVNYLEKKPNAVKAISY